MTVIVFRKRTRIVSIAGRKVAKPILGLSQSADSMARPTFVGSAPRGIGMNKLQTNSRGNANNPDVSNLALV